MVTTGEVAVAHPMVGGPVTDARYTYTAGMPAARVGWLVARARAIAGIADRDLASTIGVPLRTVRRWERGDLVPSDDEVEAIASACGTRLTELLPRRASVAYDPATGIMRMGDQAVAMPGSMLDNDSVLAAYIGLVRRQRRLRADQDVRVRQEDLEALAEALDLDDEELEERLVRVIGLSRTQAAAVRAQLLRRRLAVPMVGMLAGLSLLGVNRIFTTATEQVKTVAGGSVTRGNPYHTNPTTTTTTTTAGNDRPLIFQTPTTPPAATTTASAAATLPPVVIADSAVGPPVPGTEARTGPPRTSPRRDTSDPTTPPSSEPAPDEPATSPVTDAPTTPPASVAPTLPPDTEPPTTTTSTSGPVVTTIGGGNTKDTTTVPPPTTTTTPTTTDPGATTTTTTIDPNATTTTSTTSANTVGDPNDGGTT